jgi:hypothetical protein
MSSMQPDPEEDRAGLLYRRRWGGTVWHCSPHCLEWPADMQSEERYAMPSRGLLCPECLSLQPGPEDPYPIDTVAFPSAGR